MPLTPLTLRDRHLHIEPDECRSATYIDSLFLPLLKVVTARILSAKPESPWASRPRRLTFDDYILALVQLNALESAIEDLRHLAQSQASKARIYTDAVAIWDDLLALWSSLP